MKVGLVQINNSFSEQAYFPYAVGLMQAYLQKYLPLCSQAEFLLPEYIRGPLGEAVGRLRCADIVLFSIYAWNERISLEIARRLKEINPLVFTVFGGPQVPVRSQTFLETHPQVSVAIHGEGEQTMLDLFLGWESGRWRTVSGISYIDTQNRYVRRPDQRHIDDLDAIPSPYLSGTFDRLMALYPRKWIGLLETNRGCPFSCAFCDWGGTVDKKIRHFSAVRVFQELEWFSKRNVEFIFCCDANFGIVPRDLDIARFAARLRRESGFPKALSVQNTKNATARSFEIQKILSVAGLNKGVTLSVQSLAPATLVNVGRQNISLKEFHLLQQRFNREGIETYTDIIIGLPGETYRSFVNGVSRLIEEGQHHRIQFNNLSILPNSSMGDPGYHQYHGMEIVESSIINVHGTMADENNDIQERQQLVVGTTSMPKSDWRRARVFGWMTGLVYFDKLLQIPIILLHETCGVSYGTILELFVDADSRRYQTIGRILDFLGEKAFAIQRGETEYCHTSAYLDIYWPADEYLLIQLLSEERIDSFYSDSLDLLTTLISRNHPVDSAEIIESAVRLNKLLLKRPFQTKDVEFKANYAIWEMYQDVLRGKPFRLKNKKCGYRIDRTSTVWNKWDDFCREVIWYGNKKGAYLYGSGAVQPIFAGIR